MADAVAKIIIKSDTAEAVDGAKKVDDAYKTASENVSKGFTVAGGALTAFAAIGTAAMYSFVTAASEAEANQRMLEHAVVDVSHGTQEQVTALQDLAAQVMANGVLDDDAIIRGQAQLSTFGLQTQSVYDLTQSMADLAVNQYGVSAGGAELEASANMIAKALQGQFGALEKSGIRFSQAQQDMIMYGTEAEKVSAIQEGFAQNLKYTNEVAAQTFEGAMANLENQFGSFQESLGSALIPTLMEFGALLGDLAGWLNSLSPDTVEIIAKVLLFGTAIAGILGPILLFIGMIPSIVAGFVAIGAAATATWAAITGPIGLVVLAIMGLIALGALIWANWETIKQYAVVIWETIRDTFIIVWEAIKTAVAAALDWVSAKITAVFDGIKAVFETFWGYIYPFFAVQLALLKGIITGDFGDMETIITDVWEAITDFLGVVWEGIKEIFNVSLAFIKSTFETVWTGIKDFFILIWDTMKNFVATTFQKIIDVILGYYDAFAGAFQTLWNGAAAVVSSGVDAFVGSIKGMINGMITLINQAIKGLNSLASAASEIPGVNIPTIPSIPYLAEGGIVTSPTLAMIGEGGGPEAVIPLDKMGQFGGSGEIHFHFDDAVISSKETVMELFDMATREFGLSNKMV